jgi:hypothetical protein
MLYKNCVHLLHFFQHHHFAHPLPNPELTNMDLFNKIKNQQPGNTTEQGDAAAQQSNPAASGEQEDYLDKGNVQIPGPVNGYLTSHSQVSMLLRGSLVAARSTP